MYGYVVGGVGLELDSGEPGGRATFIWHPNSASHASILTMIAVRAVRVMLVAKFESLQT